MDKYLDMTKPQFDAFLALPIDKPIQMLNLLKFREGLDENGQTGVENYQTYSAAAFPFLKAANAKILYFGEAQSTLIGPESEWDKVLIVEYPSKHDFLSMVTAENYPAKLRQAALVDSRLILCLAS